MPGLYDGLMNQIDTKTKWSKDQAKAVAKKARKRAGDGWALLSPALREALVSVEVLNMLRAQCETSRFGSEDVQALTDAAMEAAGVDTSNINA